MHTALCAELLGSTTNERMSLYSDRSLRNTDACSCLSGVPRNFTELILPDEDNLTQAEAGMTTIGVLTTNTFLE